MPARVQPEPFDLAAELAGFGAGSGAVVTFSGLVRSEDGRLVALELEHYPAMTQKALQAFGERAAERFGLDDWRIVHRHGLLAVGQPIMMVATAARHRKQAFEAAEFLMDWLKSRAPFWKREIGPDGPGDWVAATADDEDALARW
ncbi:molybdenum cofactor biosynthesis protein MoaE [Paracoccus shanxieyensis]|uniref:Molybdopterin synthase catalytic subunit n=1 Tax=Paracoccus shanxieyensis TaxID=2675752 RepID=A0A6L6IT69_9RHOB|nr:molybdenum cofactor biosynthesis protein MoaE [Paracoccus shanxieyensis]MTH62818.1 molybdenum cofactor biosynthesis protein MoaE [Paracoccus shanxieyensis]MTH86098.1 molybdenum cofactor biosynthesis protein MoaE [Paracoccus shanxieyensis]